VAQVKQRLARRAEEESTCWALDGDEDGDEGVYADSDIPDEAAKVRDLLGLVPGGYGFTEIADYNGNPRAGLWMEARL